MTREPRSDRNRRPIRSARPAFEPLEGRALLASLMVTNALDSGAGSLRQAITDANAATGASTIGFAIPGAGVHTITPATNLPALTQAVTIDATTEPGYAGTPVIAIDGATQGTSVGLTIESGSAVAAVKGLAVEGFGYAQIYVISSGATIQDDYLGVAPTGAPGAGNNNGYGLILSGLAGVFSPAANVITGNVIGGNNTGIFLTENVNATISNNFIGTDAAGRAGIGNALDGIIAVFGTHGAAVSNNTIADNGRFAINDQSQGGLTASGNNLANNGVLAANLSVTATTTGATANGLSALTGQTITTTYTVTNNGPLAATNATLNVGSQFSQGGLDGFNIPSTVYRFAGAVTSAGTVTPSTGLTLETAQFGTLAPGDSASLTVAARVIGSGNDVFLANASSDQTTTLPAAATVTKALNAIGNADIAVAAAPPPLAQVGQPVTFTFVVTNRDPLYSTDALIAVGFTSTAAIAGVGVLTSQGNVMSLRVFPNGFGGDLGTLAPGASAVVSAVIVPAAGGVVSASVYSYSTNNIDPSPANNLAFAAAQARSYPTLLGATAQPPTGPVGAIAVYLAGPVNVSEAQDVRNYALTAAGSTARIKIRSATYDQAPFAGATHIVTLRLARPLARPATLQLVVAGPGSPGLTGTDGSKLINGGVALNLS